MNRRRMLAGVVGVALLWLVGCGSGDGGNGAPAGTTRVRFVHAATGADNVDVMVDGGVAVSNLAFSDTGRALYTGIAPGTHRVSLNRAGTAETLATVNNVVLQDGKSYTAVATGRADNGSLTVRLIEDVAPTTTSPTIKLLHYAQNEVLILDAYVTAPTASIASRSPNRNLVFNTPPTPLEFAPGTYRIRITRSNSKNPLIDLDGFTLTAGQRYEAILFDAPGNTATVVLKPLP